MGSTSLKLGRNWTASELRKLPAHERDAILEAAAALAEAEYRNNPDLTAFEAFGKERAQLDEIASGVGSCVGVP